MLVVNPENGKAIVADIADSGPSPWTGKHFGGSPAVMVVFRKSRRRTKRIGIIFFHRRSK